MCNTRQGTIRDLNVLYKLVNKITMELSGLYSESGILSEYGVDLRPNEAIGVTLSSRGKHVLWTFDTTIGRSVTSDQTAGKIESLSSLRTGSDVVRFVERYGPLGLCRHGCATTCHVDPIEQHDVYAATSLMRCKYSSSGDSFEFKESVRHYLTFARLIEAVINIVNDLRVVEENSIGEIPDHSERWKQISTGLGLGSGRSMNFLAQPHWADGQQQPDSQLEWSTQTWSRLRDVIKYLCAIGNVTLDFNPNPVSSHRAWIQANPIGDVAVHLMGLTDSSSALAICQNCLRVYFPNRRPKRNQYHVCKRTSCMASQARRRKLRAKKPLKRGEI